MPKETNHAAKRWCFTINNYTDDDIKLLEITLTSNAFHFAIVGKEVGASGTAHLQGYLNSKKRIRFTGVKKLVGTKAHIEKARGSDKDNDKYCSKEGNLVLRVGEPGEGTEKGGRRYDTIPVAIKMSKELSTGSSAGSLLEDEECAAAFITHRKAIFEMSQELRQHQEMSKQREEFADVVWRQWQWMLIRYLRDCEPCPRKVIWFCDTRGDSGKTFLSKYLCCEMGAIRFENGKSSDLKYAYNGERIVIFDLSRSQEDHVNYEAMESIKNGIMFSTKYDSTMKIFRPPHFVVFANFGPIYNKLSEDRWCVRELTEKDRLPWGDSECDTDQEVGMMEEDMRNNTTHKGKWPFLF